MKGASRDFLTGLVALAGLAGLGSLLFIFGEIRDLFAKTYEFEFRIVEAAGLRPTSDVALQGVRIGTIVSIRNAYEDPLHGVDVRVKVQGDARVPRSFKLYMDKGFVGDAVLDFQIPDGASLAPPDLIQPGEYLQGTRQVDSLFNRVETALSAPLDRLGKAADRIDKVGAAAEDFFAPRTIDDVKAGKPPNLASTVQRIDIALANANAWLADESLHNDVREFAAAAKTAIADVQKTSTSLREAADSAKAQIQIQGDKIGNAADQLTAQTTATLQKIDLAAGEFQKLAAGINSGEGTLGQLAKNPDLYNSLRDAAVRLDRSLTELQLLIQKLKDEGIPIQF
ncbi:MAG: hypothetical protein IT435_01135 [Phycisphaerales bacterium]|nr:hypothetical protein [Phycisphaerales bacterium]